MEDQKPQPPIQRKPRGAPEIEPTPEVTPQYVDEIQPRLVSDLIRELFDAEPEAEK